MRHVHPKHLLLALLTILLGSGHLSAQRAQDIVTDQDGKPVRVAHEIVVRFESGQLNKAVIDDQSIADGRLSDFLNPEALWSVSNAMDMDMSGIHVWKIFTHQTTEQTTTLNQVGEEVPLDEFWSILMAGRT